MSGRLGVGCANGLPAQAEKKISKRSCNVLKEFQEKNMICDAEILCDAQDASQVSFAIHRVIMCACSPYLRALFTNQMKETNEKQVHISGVSPEMMQLVIDYAYTREVDINSDNVQNVLPVAEFFNIDGLVAMCCEFMGNSLSVENCLGIRNFASYYSCLELKKKATRFALFHFVKLAKESEEVLELSATELVELLSNDELNVKNEEAVFELIVRWISVDEEHRIENIAQLMNTVRLGLIPDNSFMEKIKSHPFIKDRREVKPLIIRALRLLYDLELDENRDMDVYNPLTRPRVPHEVLFVVGGWSGGSPTNVVETYDTRADRWVHCAFAQDAGPRAYHGCASVDGLIYVIGGFDGMDYFNSVRCFNPSTNTWKEVAPMNSARCYVSVAVLEGCVYAMGGFNGQTRQNSAERYTPCQNQWSLIEPMHMNRSDANAASLDGRVFIVGGFNGTECMNTAEYYDPRTENWTVINPMRNRRSGVSCIGYHGCIYAVGGFNGITRMNSAEKYNPQTGEWTPIADMYNPRSNFAIEVVDDLMFVIGGFNGVTTIFNVECYDDNSDEWMDASDMNLFKSALSACVVSDLENIRDYLHPSRHVQATETNRSDAGDRDDNVESNANQNNSSLSSATANNAANSNNSSNNDRLSMEGAVPAEGANASAEGASSASSGSSATRSSSSSVSSGSTGSGRSHGSGSSLGGHDNSAGEYSGNNNNNHRNLNVNNNNNNSDYSSSGSDSESLSSFAFDDSSMDFGELR